MPEFQNRTLICSVLFIDIVEYSRKPVVEQSYLKDRFNALLSDALRGVAINDRIILDTGDGAAISFIGDPEDALFVATSMRDVIASLPDSGAQPRLNTRMGINLGPVRLVKDINGQPNIIGDGINVAQRVMTFAQPGQVLVSRSYYEVVSRLSDEWAQLFSYEGARTDKHIREHEVYAVGALPGARRRFELTDTAQLRARAESSRGAALARASETMKTAAERVAGRPRVATALAVVAILGVALGARAYRESGDDVDLQPVAVAPVQPAAAVTPAVAETPAAPLPPIKGMPPEPTAPAVDAAPGNPSAKPAENVARREQPPREPASQREQPPAREAPRASESAAPEAVAVAAPAVVSLAVSPWGEVHIDGRMRGVSPPLQQLEIEPGRHRIELRNSGSRPHVVTIDAKAGERVRIKHKFR